MNYIQSKRIAQTLENILHEKVRFEPFTKEVELFTLQEHKLYTVQENSANIGKYIT